MLYIFDKDTSLLISRLSLYEMSVSIENVCEL